MADPIREAAGSAPSSPATTTPAPEPFEPDEPPWPEILAAGGRVSDDAVGDYLRRLGRYALLTAEQEVELAQEIEAGLFAEQLLADGRQRHGDDVAELQAIALLGRRAADALLHANLRLVVSIAKHFTRRGLDLPDLIQEGNLGLLRAVRMFDFSMGFRFSTLATTCIRSDIIRALADQARLIRLPTNVVHQLQQVRSAQRAAAMAATACSNEDLSRLTDIPIGKVECLLAADQPVSSLDSAVPDGRGGTEALAEQLWDSSTPDATHPIFHQQLKAQLQVVLGTLQDREARVIAMRFGLAGGAQSLDAVAKSYAMPRESIRRIETLALAKLKDPSRSSLLRQFQFDGEGPPGGEAESAPAALSPSAPATAATPPVPLPRVPASQSRRDPSWPG
ncbi:sigma-70 family RNA polymerase sigma factor [Arthrobacter sp. YAF17]|uniref:sigma-70 family RNA polymerase sigma factor n=1 Tax=Arthrobacter sp. YAF17 TaxID=3233077 RepID=UPI003F91482A